MDLCNLQLCGVQTITATPRQLESLIRISESLARMRLSPVVERSDAAEALRLMQVSCLDELHQALLPIIHALSSNASPGSAAATEGKTHACRWPCSRQPQIP
jgi:hypothetical protein